MSERYVSLDQLVHTIQTEAVYVVVQRRRHYNTCNYGEFIGYINGADRMRWDAFVPGYTGLPRNVPLRVKGIVGILMTETGNHKVAVTVDSDCAYDRHLALQQASSFKQKYIFKKSMHCEFFVTEADVISQDSSSSSYSVPSS